MAESQDLINFDIIEAQKENIQALPSGRSAKALAQLYSPPLFEAQPSPALSETHIKARSAFEKELAEIDEADDPLDVYDRYVKWTLDAFPSAQATPQSQLLPLLERATKTFQGSPLYKDDPRYLKIWLHYIRLFSDAPRETFVFLARHGIGEGLALYYEEFAAWLENAGRWNQAEEIYKMGTEKEARPGERLLRKFGEFERRKQAQPESAFEPSSPVLPTVRPALAAKLDPFAASSHAGSQQQSQPAATKKSKSSKMAIFSDDDAAPRPESGGSAKGWDSIGSLSDRRKENTIEAKPWAGEKLNVGKTNGGVQKMMIFKDKSSRNPIPLPKHIFSRTHRNHRQQCTVNPTTGRTECIYVNLEALYPERKPRVEFSFEELMASRRGLLSVDWSKKEVDDRTCAPASPKVAPVEKEPFKIFTDEPPLVEDRNDIDTGRKPKERSFNIFEDVMPIPDQSSKPSQEDHDILVQTFSKTLALNDENDENTPPPPESDIDLAKKARKEEKANRTRKIKVLDVKHIKNETKTIQLNMDSPSGPKMKRKKSGDRPEPTMTINTREAMDEIYGIFNQPLQTAQPDEDEEDSESDDDYTTGDESTATGKLSAPASEYGEETRNELLGHQQSADAERTDVSDWSDFTRSKHVPEQGDEEDVISSEPNATQDSLVQEDTGEDEEAVTTPLEDENPRTRYVPVPPEDYEPPMTYYRDPNMIPNHRLPFMTPIVERTESSLGGVTARTEKSYLGVKTPSRNTGMPDLMDDDEEEELGSSPFQDITSSLEEDKRRVLQPIRTKTTQGTISLGHGSVKSQIDAKKIPLATEAAHNGPIITDEQCNPMDPYLREVILAQMKPSLTSFEGYHEHLSTSLGRTSEIRKYIKAQTKAKASGTQDRGSQVSPNAPVIDLEGAQSTYTVKRELGAGTFAPVYLVENAAMGAIDAEDETKGEGRALARVGPMAHRRALEAIKMEEPASTWEFYMLRQLHRRLGVTRPAESVIRAHEMHLYRDECYLVEEFRDQGTLLDLVNIARAENGGGGGGMDETLAMFFTIELLRTVEALHSKQLIHGDLKGDNVLVRFDDPGPETDWSATYFPSGAHGWSSKGVSLIDLGRGIDLRHFLPTVGFIADWKTTEADCAEMRELRPWTYQIDYHGLAGIVHSLLFGKYMETVSEKANPTGDNNSSGLSHTDQPIGLGGGAALGCGAGSKTYRIRESLKRYWQTELWGELFALLLNPLTHAAREDPPGRLPVVRGLRGCRERMEGWLEENCERGVGLKASIVKMEAAVVRERRRRTAARVG